MIMGKESVHKEKQSLEGKAACKKVCTRKATDGWRNNTHTWEEDLTSVGLGFW